MREREHLGDLDLDGTTMMMMMMMMMIMIIIIKYIFKKWDG